MRFLILATLFAFGSCQFGLPIPKTPLGRVGNAATNLAGGAVNAAAKTAQQAKELFGKQFGDFKSLYKKAYSTVEEEALRKNIFVKNSENILNLAKGAGLSFIMKANEYTDLLHDEFNKAVNGFNKGSKKAEKPIPQATSFKEEKVAAEIPDSFDWREKGAVTPVKSQGLCAGCWAFSTAGAIEGHNFRKTGKLIELSPQNLIDCAGPYGNDGCQGGLMNPAFQYIKENKGLNKILSYPFEAKDGKCRYASTDAEITDTLSGYVEIPSGDEKALKEAVATYGPVSVAIDASPDRFQFYSDGIYYDPKCKNKPEDLNHAVLVVGYGADPDGQKYWIIKNSYGTSWGKSGYIKLARERGNHCGVATYASYPKI